VNEGAIARAGLQSQRKYIIINNNNNDIWHRGRSSLNACYVDRSTLLEEQIKSALQRGFKTVLSKCLCFVYFALHYLADGSVLQFPSPLNSFLAVHISVLLSVKDLTFLNHIMNFAQGSFNTKISQPALHFTL
jgi:hypothetical protein